MDVYQESGMENLATVPVPAPDMEGLGELTNALGNIAPSKRAVAGAPTATPVQQDEVAPSTSAAASPTTPTPQPGQEAQLLSRWYQLVGEMQCLMSQMQQLGMQPPGYPMGQPQQAPPVPPVAQTPAPVPAMPAVAPLSVKVGVAAKPATSSLNTSLANSPNTWNPSQDPVVGSNTPPAQQDSPLSAEQQHINAQMIQGAALINANRRQTAIPPRAQSGAVNHHNRTHHEPAPYIALVEFKRQRIRRYEAMLFVKPGEYVVVDGDRGTDCGFVVQCAVRNSDGSYGHTESIDNQPVDPNRVKSEAGRIHRVATTAEVNNLHNEIASMERFALKTCRERVADMQLNMEIVDCEFQFDRKKVTFFFDSHESIDFRDLTKDLYRLFGSRIWLENINTKVKNMVPEGALSHSDKMMYAQKGLRAPR